MRFLSLTPPPKDRLVRQDPANDEREWRKQWRQMQALHHSSQKELWTPQQILTFFCVVLFLVALFILFSQ